VINRRAPRGVACKTRGQDGFAVLFSRRALSSPTTCRFIPALSEYPVTREQSKLDSDLTDHYPLPRTGLLARFAELAAKCRASPTRPHLRPTCGGPPRGRGFIRNETGFAERELPTAPPPPSLRSPSWDGKPPDQWIVRNFAELRTSWGQSKPSRHSPSRP
jgi:hypothetical protein